LLPLSPGHISPVSYQNHAPDVSKFHSRPSWNPPSQGDAHHCAATSEKVVTNTIIKWQKKILIFCCYIYYVRTFEEISGDDKVGSSYKQKQKIATTKGPVRRFSVFNVLAHNFCISGVKKYYQLLY
jgi:hypothetical protein